MGRRGHNATYVRKAQTLAIRVVDGQAHGSIDLLWGSSTTILIAPSRGGFESPKHAPTCSLTWG